MTKDVLLVPHGQFKGRAFAKIPEDWLYYRARKSNPDFLGRLCRKELVRRYALEGKPNPWGRLDEEEEITIRGQTMDYLVIDEAGPVSTLPATVSQSPVEKGYTENS